MEKKTLLAEIETEQKVAIEKKFLQQKEKTLEKKKETKSINIFSSSAFPKQETAVSKQPEVQQEVEKEIQQEIVEEKEVKAESENSSVIEKPNYDFIETLSNEQREKIFKIEKVDSQAQPKPRKKMARFKIAVFAILFALFGVWGIVNLTMIDSVSTQVSEVSTEYSINLIKYLNKLHNLDAANTDNMQNLLETIPEEELPPSTIISQSNWFDRFCNFIAGLFGG